MVNTLVLKIRKSDGKRIIIDVYTNKYFVNNKRVETIMLGLFLDKKLISLDRMARKTENVWKPWKLPF